MTQKDMEARLIALEAEYAQKKLEADAQIRREQKDSAGLCTGHQYVDVRKNNMAKTIRHD